MEVVRCHTTEALSEMQTSMSVQTWSGEFNVTYVDSRPHEVETAKPKDEEQEVTSADANESGSSAELEKGFTAFPPNCEPSLGTRPFAGKGLGTILHSSCPPECNYAW